MIVGSKDVEEAFRKLSLVDIHGAASRAIKKVQAEAKRLCPSHDGELRDSIYTNVEWGAEYVRASCYTNKSYGPYVEFGTGPRGQENHKNISPDVTVAYNQTGWMIPAYAMSRKEAEAYHLGVIKNSKGEVIGYATNGQEARPYMYPALKNQADEVTKAFDEAVRRQL